MIAGILSPLSVATALYVPWFGVKCLSTVPRGTTGKKIRPWNFSRGPILSAHEGRSCIYVPMQNGRWSTAKDKCSIWRMNDDRSVQTFRLVRLMSGFWTGS